MFSQKAPLCTSDTTLYTVYNLEITVIVVFGNMTKT